MSCKLRVRMHTGGLGFPPGCHSVLKALPAFIQQNNYVRNI